jgi:hypothetical protein
MPCRCDNYESETDRKIREKKIIDDTDKIVLLINEAVNSIKNPKQQDKFRVKFTKALENKHIFTRLNDLTVALCEWRKIQKKRGQLPTNMSPEMTSWIKEHDDLDKKRMEECIKQLRRIANIFGFTIKNIKIE